MDIYIQNYIFDYTYKNYNHNYVVNSFILLGKPTYRAFINDRVSAIEKWTAVADICRCLHNFNGVLQVCAAFTNAAVYRLKKTWDKVSKPVSVYYILGVAIRCLLIATLATFLESHIFVTNCDTILLTTDKTDNQQTASDGGG